MPRFGDYDSDYADSDSDSDVESLSSMGGYSVADTETSYNRDSNRSNSPTPSVLSLTDDMRALMFKQEYGRTLNNYSEVYRLPVDEEEWARLDKQHDFIVYLMGGKYAPPMAEIMADNIPGEAKACVDLGCGSGSWILSVANDFPHCSAVAIDLIPLQADVMPPNLRCEVDDINIGLDHFYNDFNVAHARLLCSGIRDYQRLIDEVSKILRPGGLIDVCEFDYQMYDDDHNLIEVDVNDESTPKWARWLYHLREAIQMSGGDVDAANHLREWITEHPDFEQVVYRDYWPPIIPTLRNDPWKQTESKRRFFKIFQDDLRLFLSAGRPALLGSGLSEEYVDRITAEALQESKEGKIPQFTHLQSVYARKKMPSS